MDKAKTLCLLSLLVFDIMRVSLQCGPGPSGSRRNKILKPMVLYQRLPDVDEESISGSGMFRRIVTEKSKEYKELVKNYNKDVVFESGEGKRIMTKRCREKIDKLARLVKLEWPNVKLRVIEAYDKYGQHPPNSLHYEARAVDITTSDRDKSKIGSLGSLAFQAGFDWVHYESHSYIHASVVSENEVSLKQADCFPGSSKIETLEHGMIDLEALKNGDHVLTYEYANGKFKGKYTEVLGFLDSAREIQQQYLSFKTAEGNAFAATKTHLIYTIVKPESLKASQIKHGNSTRLEQKNALESHTIGKDVESTDNKAFIFPKGMQATQFHDRLQMDIEEPSLLSWNDNISARFAKSLSVGDKIVTNGHYGATISTISAISEINRRGAYAPLTKEGNFVVDGVWVSCYAKIENFDTAQTALAAFRTVATLAPVNARQKVLNWYVKALTMANDAFGIVTLH